MAKKSWYSAIVVLVILAGCVVFGAENANDINETKADTPPISIAPIEVNIPPIKVLPVKVQNSVKVENQKSKDGWTILIALATALAAIGAWLAAKNTRLVAEGELFTKLLWEYSSPQMLQDLNRVFKWHRKYGLDGLEKKPIKAYHTAKEWIEQLHEPDEQDNGSKIEAKKLDEARRHITHFFLSILDLDESDYTTKKWFVTKGKCFISRKKVFAEHVCKAVGTRVVYVVFPLEVALIRHIGKRENDTKEEIRKDVTNLKNKFKRLKKLSGGKKNRN